MARKRVTQKHLADLKLEDKLDHWVHGDNYDPHIGLLVGACRSLLEFMDRAKASDAEAEVWNKIIALVGGRLMQKTFSILLRSLRRRDGKWLKQMANAVERNGPVDPKPLLIVALLFRKGAGGRLEQYKFPTRTELKRLLEARGHKVDESNLTRWSRDIPFNFKGGPDRTVRRGVN